MGLGGVAELFYLTRAAAPNPPNCLLLAPGTVLKSAAATVRHTNRSSSSALACQKLEWF
jgi:hypothetical protein